MWIRVVHCVLSPSKHSQATARDRPYYTRRPLPPVMHAYSRGDPLRSPRSCARPGHAPAPVMLWNCWLHICLKVSNSPLLKAIYHHFLFALTIILSLRSCML